MPKQVHTLTTAFHWLGLPFLSLEWIPELSSHFQISKSHSSPIYHHHIISPVIPSLYPANPSLSSLHQHPGKERLIRSGFGHTQSFSLAKRFQDVGGEKEEERRALVLHLPLGLSYRVLVVVITTFTTAMIFISHNFLLLLTVNAETNEHFSNKKF